MKKLLLLSLTLMLLFSNLQTFGQTSVYHPFPDSNAVWNIDSHEPCGLYFDTWEHLYSIIISGDTIINAINYHKLKVPIEVINANGTCDSSGTWTTKGYYVGSIRQDKPNKKVYFVPSYNSTEQLLYDFTMQVGDSVQGYIESYNFPGFIPHDVVQSIDSVLVGGTYRKRWNINSGYSISFIEGIGSTYGLIERSPRTVLDFPDFAFTCFKQNGQPLYPDTATNCQVIVSVNTIESCSYQVLVSPNPAKETVNFEFGNIQNHKQAHLRCYDVFGNLLYNETVVQGQKEVVLDISSWPSGMYVAVVYSNGGVVGKSKFVVE